MDAACARRYYAVLDCDGLPQTGTSLTGQFRLAVPVACHRSLYFLFGLLTSMLLNMLIGSRFTCDSRGRAEPCL
jgi:hypothetical protein